MEPFESDGMVDGGVSTEPARRELTTLPGAWVELRMMPYGDVLERQDMVMDMKVEMAERGKKSSGKMDLQMANVKTTAHDFKACIVRHNIRNPRTGRAFQFGNMNDWYGVLHPRVGKEIDRHISELNGFGDDDEDFTEKPGNGSGPEMDLSPQ